MKPDKILNIVEQATTLPVDPLWFRAGENMHELYYRFIFLLAKEFAVGSTFVELGTWRGGSSMVMAEGAPGAVIFTYDVNQGQLYEAAKRSNVNYESRDSVQVMPEISAVDLLFIDTEHDGARPLLEFESWKHLLGQDSVVLFDDITLNDKMKKFWAEFNPSGYKKLEIPVHGSAGFGVLLRSTDDDGGVTQ